MNEEFHVVKTLMFPNSFKVESKQWPGRNNSISEYFPSEELAQMECDRRNHAGVSRPL